MFDQKSCPLGLSLLPCVNQSTMVITAEAVTIDTFKKKEKKESATG